MGSCRFRFCEGLQGNEVYKVISDTDILTAVAAGGAASYVRLATIPLEPKSNSANRYLIWELLIGLHLNDERRMLRMGKKLVDDVFGLDFHIACGGSITAAVPFI